MNRRIGTRVAACILTVLTLAVPAAADNYWVVLAGGQSNMEGAASVSSLSTLEPALLANPSNVSLYNYSYGGHYVGNLIANGQTTFGPEVKFIHNLTADYPAQKVIVIKYAEGGTNLEEQWDPTPESGENNNCWLGFTGAVTSILGNLTLAGNTYQVKGMIWMQGEEDGKWDSMTANHRYQANMVDLINHVRALPQVNQPTLPFVMGEIADMGPARQYGYRVLADQDSFMNQAYMPYVDCVASKNLTTIAAGNAHFDAAGQIALGNMMYNSYVVLTPEPATLALLALGALAMIRHHR